MTHIRDDEDIEQGFCGVVSLIILFILIGLCVLLTVAGISIMLIW